MTRIIAPAASILQLGYGLMLKAVGAAGILTAPWELRTVFHLDPAAWPHEVHATFLNQYRFLKAVEFSAGVFCIAYHKTVLTGGRAAWVFLVLVVAGVAARTLSWVVEGAPSALFLTFLALESLVFAAVALHLSSADARART